MLLLEFEWHTNWEVWLFRGSTAALQRLEDGESGRKSAKMSALQMVPRQYGSSTCLVEFPGTLGHWGVDYLPPPRTVDSSSPFNREFLRMPGVTLLVSAAFPRDSRDLLGQLG